MTFPNGVWERGERECLARSALLVKRQAEGCNGAPPLLSGCVREANHLRLSTHPALTEQRPPSADGARLDAAGPRSGGLCSVKRKSDRGRATQLAANRVPPPNPPS